MLVGAVRETRRWEQVGSFVGSSPTDRVQGVLITAAICVSIPPQSPVSNAPRTEVVEGCCRRLPAAILTATLDSTLECLGFASIIHRAVERICMLQAMDAFSGFETASCMMHVGGPPFPIDIRPVGFRSALPAGL